jgi:hypothetical protein
MRCKYAAVIAYIVANRGLIARFEQFKKIRIKIDILDETGSVEMLTAQEHQKIAVLQQVANLVGQAQSVSGNQGVLNNVINNLLPQISQWERSDPEFAELAIQMRRARTGNSPHHLANMAGQAQRMISLARGGLGYKVNRQGERVVWDPIRGNVTSPLWEEGEPVTPQSVYGWRGSQKYPFGRGIPEWNVIEGYGDLGEGTWGKIKGTVLGLGAGVLVGIAAEQLVDNIEHPILKEIAAPASSSVTALVIYWLVK